MAWFKKSKEVKTDKKIKIPEGLWVKCDSCKEIIYKKEIDKNLKICPKCNYHFRISAKERIKLFVDEGSFVEIDSGLASNDPLNFKDKIPYKDRLEENREKKRTSGGCHLRRGDGRGASCDHCNHGLCVYGRKYGVCCRRKGHAGRRGCAGEENTPDNSCFLRRRKDAGRHILADADGQGVCCDSKT